MTVLLTTPEPEKSLRVDTVTAQQVVEAVARSLPAPSRLFGVPARPMPARRPEAPGRHQTPRRFGPWRHGRRRSVMPGRLMGGLATLAALVFFYAMN